MSFQFTALDQIQQLIRLLGRVLRERHAVVLVGKRDSSVVEARGVDIRRRDPQAERGVGQLRGAARGRRRRADPGPA